MALVSSVGVGLTLTKATQVVMFGPLGKPTDEEQCFGRAHRLSQTEPVKVYKFHCAGAQGVDSERVVKQLSSARSMFGEEGSLWQAKNDEAGTDVLGDLGE